MAPNKMSSDVLETNREDILTPIQKFYAGANVLITGGTGFLGKLLIEKLLRSCPELSTVYVLVRSKKGKEVHERVEELFEDAVFGPLAEQFPKFRHKVVGVAGDCGSKGLGLSEQDRQMLISEISIVFHVAATVRFDEKLKTAVAINIQGPKEMVELCKKLPNLKAAVHVSTAYAQCAYRFIEERFYPAPLDYEKLVLLTEALPENLLDNITPALLDRWPNTYTYTKAIAEDVVRTQAQDLPFGVFRPSIIISTYKEPIRGWINNLYGPTGVCAGAGAGFLRTLHCDANVEANIIPVDMCTNALIAVACDVGKNYETCKSNQLPFINPIYHYESSTDKPITWGRFMDICAKYGMKWPYSKAIWYYSLQLWRSYFVYALSVFFLHYLPAVVGDGVAACFGKSPRLVKAYKKIHKFCNVIAYFSTRHWEFRSERIRAICEDMSKEDKEIFFCDLRKIDWDEYFKEYIKGIRLYLLQDPLETLEAARIKWNRLYWLHQVCKLLLVFGFLRLVWYVFEKL